MKRLIFALPLLVLSLSGCSSPEDEPYSNSENKEREIVVSSLNPMNEPLMSNQYYLNHIGDIYSTWRSYQGNGMTIAVIDTGFKYDHEDFTYEDGTSKVSELSASFKISGSKVKKEVGRNKVSSGSGDNAHGTFCAGVAAAGINKKGVIGIAPLAELLLLKTDGHPYSINEAFKYAADNGAKVVTISIGSYKNFDGDLKKWKTNDIDLETVFEEGVDYCREKGTLVVSAAGNGGLDPDHARTEFTYPGGTKGVIGAGGLAKNKSDEVWDGSSYNSSNSKVFCDVFAPADGMYGCTDHYDSSVYYSYAGGWDGTSFASPIVAGIATLYFEKNPEATLKDFEDDLRDSSRKFKSTGLSENNIGYGRIDVGQLLDTKATEEVTIKIKNTGNLNAYIWNSITGSKKSNWPGIALSQSGGYFTVTVDTTKYDSIIFNDGTTQAVDLYASSFLFGNAYNLDVEGGDPFVGQYIAN